ncbi:maleylpyruvate isomerase N-terminal domain-containing protein [Flavilitoribacter nigricans]|uniref:Mycothiol-dependent maleylpyruvate isomerase metal-binding domain-containing protein n=1 Tax=Flavilitoribacter nigricans (strain ATCC 23147 / DSM 23189 / NBRC 102662 / NCIMB 1420 / SS-2) TaxID=1122177 RepID=A0A2D0NGX7_FLAN2|nr:maleylpyruvate isomerase N-terminal domain-containing protein [Flavilitoribacter nigricans]PHN07741.1 hypothetical protein CRP01_04920 [Flavilitoribacter nigricans DSM 23189 = NBRC 102662]
MEQVEPIFVLDRIRLLHLKLLELLRSLDDAGWQKPTIAGHWRVRDIAAHLLDGQLRSVSMLRDGYFGESPGTIHSYRDLVDFLNRLNAEWISATRRLSPPVLIHLLEGSGPQYIDLLAGLDPFAPATFSVAWAGESTSPNWFHIAREYTEQWHHQQQIRLAVGREEALYEEVFYRPYLDISMRALPHHYREVEVKEGKVVQFIVTGDGGGSWWLVRRANSWQLTSEKLPDPACIVRIPERIAWRLFTKGIDRQTALDASQISGDQSIGEPIFNMLAVMA